MTEQKPKNRKDEEKERMIRWMSGDSPKPALAGESAKNLTVALVSSDCRFIAPALADFAELHLAEASARMPAVAEHLKICPVCQKHLECLRTILSEHSGWLALAQALGSTSTHPLVALIANAWYWLSGESAPAVRLSQEDFAFRRRLGEWMLFQTATVFAMSSGQGSVNSLGLAIDFTQGARLHLVVTPEHIASTHREMWRLSFELQVGSSVDHLSIELLDQNKRSEGIRTLHPDKPKEFRVDPPAAGGYSLLLTWSDVKGQETEHTVDLPFRAGGVSADA